MCNHLCYSDCTHKDCALNHRASNLLESEPLMTTTAVATTWTADTVHSTANFAVKHSGVATFRGSFDDVVGSLDLTSGEPRLTGTTQRVTAKGTWLEIEADMTGNPRIGVDIDTTIDRTAFGLNWNAPLPKGGVALANDVKLSVHLELVPAQG